jgi:hypothetical protein
MASGQTERDTTSVVECRQARPNVGGRGALACAPVFPWTRPKMGSPQGGMDGDRVAAGQCRPGGSVAGLLLAAEPGRP